jgi:DNA-binding HxlR family transcriptional regulator
MMMRTEAFIKGHPMRDGRRLRQFDCPAYGFQKIISGKYKVRILWDLQHGPRRYFEIRHGLLTGSPGSKEITPRVLSRELKELTTFGLIDRKDYGTKAPKVEYMLTKEGQSLIPVISVIHEWGVQHLVKDSVLRKLGLQRL